MISGLDNLSPAKILLTSMTDSTQINQNMAFPSTNKFTGATNVNTHQIQISHPKGLDLFTPLSVAY